MRTIQMMQLALIGVCSFFGSLYIAGARTSNGYIIGMCFFFVDLLLFVWYYSIETAQRRRK